jgi:hypothetical protein
MGSSAWVFCSFRWWRMWVCMLWNWCGLSLFRRFWDARLRPFSKCRMDSARTSLHITTIFPLPFLLLLSYLISETCTAWRVRGFVVARSRQHAYGFLGSGGGDDTREWALLVATEGKRDFSKDCGWAESLLSSPLGSGVSKQRPGTFVR